MTRTLTVVVVGALVASCQTYEFERVSPVALGSSRISRRVQARPLKPNLMLLIDTSASMLAPIDASDPSCPANCGGSTATACPAACPTRISELKRAMASFLSTAGSRTRLGLTTFPADAVCGAASRVDVPFAGEALAPDDEALLQQNAERINARIQAVTPQGGTPTGASLAFLGAQPEFAQPGYGRDDFVVLLTDGLPNCNDSNANALCACGDACAPAQVASCACTTSSCGGGLCARGCLDRDASVAEIAALHAKGVRTIVVGFGADVATGAGPAVLEAMAQAGGFPRVCPHGTDGECGGAAGSCNRATKTCTMAYYQARDAAELSAAFERIVPPENVCEYRLDERPTSEELLEVRLDDQRLAPGPETFTYDPASAVVRFSGAACRKLTESTVVTPVQVDLRIVQVL